jgi:hypothetical protein
VLGIPTRRKTNDGEILTTNKITDEMGWLVYFSSKGYAKSRRFKIKKRLEENREK